jgi:hypothetical protein
MKCPHHFTVSELLRSFREVKYKRLRNQQRSAGNHILHNHVHTKDQLAGMPLQECCG